ncbi:hypothetical protein M153_2930004378 [Pseudoloma neurophilia]|uniref:ABC transporter domain-containing protein n=1 Tax=Pseudoloma neurophilia TaxID=146866 RepID=A0A0R0LYD1_9MICR|nr:hypothetical protein M153_2930004378 [Pseudoloma neurophilia]
MESDQATFSWQNIDIEVPNKNKRYRVSRIKLISDACGSMKCGLLAIMGPSGSGKTTLLNSFVGRMPQNSHTTGKITYLGKDRDGVEFTKEVGFVDQDDTIFENLTAYQTVRYAADFRLENSKKLNLEQKIQTLFDKLSINHVKDARMSALSGGERKRVMIAVELITEPQIIFLDEPTSGLDNNSTHKLIKLLKSIADEGKTIIFTIHQPDDITASEFTKILLLSQGRTVYMGDFDKCESELIQYGLEKRPRETFSNFAMRVLDVNPDKYQDSEYGTVLNTLVEEMKKRNNFQPRLKAVKKSNDATPELAVNFKHVYLIIKRKYQMSFLTWKNLIFNIILLVFVFLCIWFFKFLLSVLDMGFSNEVVKEMIDENSSKKFFEFYSSEIIVIPFFCAILPMISGKAFYPETRQIKREIGVATYSVTSYYLATYIHEFLGYLPYLMIYLASISFYVTDESRILPIFFFNSLIFFCSLFLYLFIGSITSGPKLLTLFLVIAFIFYCIPWNFLMIFVNLRKLLSLDEKQMAGPSIPCLVMNHLFPHHMITSICMSFSIYVFRELAINAPSLFLCFIYGVYNEEIYEFARKKYPEIYKWNTYDELLKEFKKTVGQMEYLTTFYLGFNTSPYVGFVFIFIMTALYALLSIFLLSRRIVPPQRFKLNA